MAGVRLATWNVNSAKAREPRLLDWLDERAPDVVCLQETKLSDEAFAESFAAPLAERGYAVAHHGEGRWNGVALLSRVGLDDVVEGLPGAPGYPHQEARAVSATCGGLRVTSVYVPNGRDPDDPHYAYKLEWLAALRDLVEAGDPDATVVAGDFNIAPTDEDIYSVEAFAGSTHVTPPEREALATLMKTGLHDVIRERWPDDRAAAWVDRKARKGTGPSDHAPVIVDLDEAPNGDLGPVVPPPSLGRTRKK